MESIERILNHAHATLHEVGTKLGIREGWCLADHSISPPKRYPMEAGSWGFISSHSGLEAISKCPGVPALVIMPELANRNYELSLYSKGSEPYKVSLTPQELSELHQLIEQESSAIPPDGALDVLALVVRVKGNG